MFKERAFTPLLLFQDIHQTPSPPLSHYLEIFRDQNGHMRQSGNKGLDGYISGVSTPIGMMVRDKVD